MPPAGAAHSLPPSTVIPDQTSQPGTPAPPRLVSPRHDPFPQLHRSRAAMSPPPHRGRSNATQPRPRQSGMPWITLAAPLDCVAALAKTGVGVSSPPSPLPRAQRPSPGGATRHRERSGAARTRWLLEWIRGGAGGIPWLRPGYMMRGAARGGRRLVGEAEPASRGNPTFTGSSATPTPWGSRHAAERQRFLLHRPLRMTRAAGQRRPTARQAHMAASPTERQGWAFTVLWAAAQACTARRPALGGTGTGPALMADNDALGVDRQKASRRQQSATFHSMRRSAPGFALPVTASGANRSCARVTTLKRSGAQALRRVSRFLTWRSRATTAAGVTPGSRAAAPSVAGRAASSRSRISVDRLPTAA